MNKPMNITKLVSMSRWAGGFVGAATLMTGCDGTCSSTPPATSTPVAQVSWTPAGEDSLDEQINAQRARALDARAAMESELKAKLMGAIQADGPQGAIEVCSTSAPEIASQISAEYGVLIGRTSFKLRNETNTPPTWIEFVVEARQDEPSTFIGSDGTLAVAYPIKIASACLMCHGQPETITDEVRASIEAIYPNDQATGFALGDLRGWFWVEVPPQ